MCCALFLELLLMARDSFSVTGRALHSRLDSGLYWPRPLPQSAVAVLYVARLTPPILFLSPLFFLGAQPSPVQVVAWGSLEATTIGRRAFLFLLSGLRPK